jgi:hypothetical protein
MHPVPALEFCWLVELFLPYGGNSLGYYHTGFTDINGASRATRNPHEARRYTSAEVAGRVAAKLDSKQGEWRAIEHGFYLGMVTAVEADSDLNAGTEGAIHSTMIAAHDRDLARLRIVLHLMGVGDAAVDAAEAKLKEAMRVHPEGALTLTHGPFGESSATPETTFHNLIAMWWQDDDYGSQFNELLWERP